MIRKPPINLNQQSQEATILLIREVLDHGIELTEVYHCGHVRWIEELPNVSRRFMSMRWERQPRMKNICPGYSQASRSQSQPKQMLNSKLLELPAWQPRLPETPASKDGTLRRAPGMANSSGERTLDQDIHLANIFVNELSLVLKTIFDRSEYTNMAKGEHRTNIRLPQACPVLMDNS